MAIVAAKTELYALMAWIVGAIILVFLFNQIVLPLIRTLT
jgi:hypothetical protein